MQEDFSDFLDLDEFAVEVSREDGTTFAAIFDNEGEVVTIGGAVVESSKPYLMCRVEDVETLEWEKSVVSIEKAGEFLVISIKPDGTGLASVELGYAD
ncbi:hypothetical protein [Halodesulfovibrio sp. MK-HDV]|uniref:head-tail joining protein n=1 Tax=Halodesulfovibrio sp. MK-HDV TaxID=2599925 RepID=UPI00136FFF3A|nr:hypothetical protein [Halodesulfovibrio sp. MK-HDV]KAF1076283.1 hypothetical protein MKHDV_01304 [Halodesulfovibrio sp. MK-HDV]